MKHIKTFESFSSVNEEFLGLDKLWAKAKSFKNKVQEGAAEKLAKAIEAKKNDPKFIELVNKAKELYEGLSTKDKNSLTDLEKKSKMDAGIEDVPAGPNDKTDLEKINIDQLIKVTTIEGQGSTDTVSESIRIILEGDSNGLASRICTYFGLSVGAIGLIGLILAIIKYVGAVSLIGIGALSLGTLAGIAAGLFVGGGLLYGIGKISGSDI